MLLAGGYGRRFQRGGPWTDKLLHTEPGAAAPVLRRAAEAAAEVARRVIVVTRSDRLGTYRAALPDGVELLADAPGPGYHPARGLSAALPSLPPGGTVLLLSADRPRITGEALAAFVDGDGTAPRAFRAAGHVDPLLACYPSELLERVGAGLPGGVRRMTDLLRAADALSVMDDTSGRGEDDPASPFYSLDRPPSGRWPKLLPPALVPGGPFALYADRFREARERERERDWAAAEALYEEEARRLEALGLLSLAVHARTDVERCRSCLVVTP